MRILDRKVAIYIAANFLVVCGWQGLVFLWASDEPILVEKLETHRSTSKTILQVQQTKITNKKNQGWEMISIKELFDQARIQTSGIVPDESRQSMPLPNLIEGTLRVSFFFCPAVVTPQEGAKLIPPNLVCHMDPVTGTLIELRAVTPSDFGQSDDPSKELGRYTMPTGMTPIEYVNKRSRLFELYDQLLPVFSGKSHKSKSDVHLTIEEFKKSFDELSEPVLRTYYRNGAAEFFKWLDNQ